MKGQEMGFAEGEKKVGFCSRCKLRIYQVMLSVISDAAVNHSNQFSFSARQS